MGTPQTAPAPREVKAPGVTADRGVVAATVAPGRTLMIDDEYVGPGRIVHLPAKEVDSLRRRGFLTDPDAAEVLVASGPTYVKPGSQPEPRRLTLA